MYRLISSILLLGVPALTHAQTPIVLPRMDGPVQLDGFSTEASWKAAMILPSMTMYEPVFGNDPTEDTEVLAGYDDEYLYVAGRLYDTGAIRAGTLERDGWAADDEFVVNLDSYDDNENGIIFGTTPAGLRRDILLTNDAEGDRAWSVEFDTFWEVATAETEEGWFVEMRIPFSSLPFQDSGQEIAMGLSVQRVIARKGERLVFPPISPERGESALWKPSLWQTVILRGVSSENPWYVTPYGLAGATVTEAGPPASSPASRREITRSVGLDVRHNLSNNLTLDLTANTDFAQAETDDEQINLTRFSLFIPEKRRFFQERAGIFQVDTGLDSRLFHSRRIGLTEAGKAISILGGARLVGRVGEWDLGVLDMQTAAEGSVPSENFGVLRMRRQVLDPTSYVGGMITGRVTTEGRHATAYGVDGRLRLWKNEYLDVTGALTTASEQTGRWFDATRLRAYWQRRGGYGWLYDAELVRSGRDYDPGVGFLRRTDFTYLGGRLGYGWLPDSASPLFRHRLDLTGAIYRNNSDVYVESAEVGPRWEFQGRAQTRGHASLRICYENLRTGFALPKQTDVPTGTYTFVTFTGEFSTPSNSPRRATISMDAGTFYDGWQYGTTVAPVWNVSRHLELAGTYRLAVVGFPERDRRLTTHLARLNATAGLNTKVTGTVRVQYNSSLERFFANLRLRYNVREGHDLWLVYDEAMHTARTSLPSDALADQYRWTVKYTHTFDMTL